MTNNKKVSIIIPTWNCAHFLPAALDSLLAQTHSNIEIIVVDDGSTDNTRDVIAPYVVGGVQYFHQKNHGCCGAARNTAFRYVTGDYIAFIDADDIATPTRIASQVWMLDEHPSVGAVFTNFADFRGELFEPSHYSKCPRITKLVKFGNAVIPGLEARELVLDENYALPSTCMIRREVLTQVPGYSTEIRGGEDVHFAYLIARHWDIGLIDMIGAHRRLHGNNISADPLRFVQQGLLSRSLLLVAEQEPMLRKALEKYLRKVRTQLTRALADRKRYREALAVAMDARDVRGLLRTLVMAVVK